MEKIFLVIIAFIMLCIIGWGSLLIYYKENEKTNEPLLLDV
jgi:hypothetical protein